jgi:hypothetical protein
MKYLLIVPAIFFLGCGQQQTANPIPPTAPKAGAPVADRAQPLAKDVNGAIGDEDNGTVPEGKNPSAGFVPPVPSKDWASDKDSPTHDSLVPLAPVPIVPAPEVAPPVTEVPNIIPAQPDQNDKVEDEVAKEANAKGTSAANIAEKAAIDAPAKQCIQPPGFGKCYDAEDEPRVQYYKLFVSGGMDTDTLVQTMFKDGDGFNRDVEILGDIYKVDKFKKSLSPEVVVKFQELGNKVGVAVKKYNGDREAAIQGKLWGTVILGSLAGGLAGGYFIKDEFLPTVVRTKFDTYRVPLFVPKAVIGGAGAGSLIWVTGDGLHVINDWLIHPENVYNADPLLDRPSSD